MSKDDNKLTYTQAVQWLNNHSALTLRQATETILQSAQFQALGTEEKLIVCFAIIARKIGT